MMTDTVRASLDQSSRFARRHLGMTAEQAEAMARDIGYESVDALIDDVIPSDLRRRQPFRGLPEPRTEQEALNDLAQIMDQNQEMRSLIGAGYAACVTPPVIQRNILENPGWYTAYTPYQPEISQGRLEACLNFQTLIAELSRLPISNASLLDEPTAAAEAAAMCVAASRGRRRFFVSEECHPQTIAVMQTRAEPAGIELEIGDPDTWTFDDSVAGILLQYPGTSGGIADPTDIIAAARKADCKVVMACDLLALVLLTPPGVLGADIAVGSAQRFGVPLGFGGPHAGWIACTDSLKRKLPGRIVGISRDAEGRPAYRLALQTREQHLSREKATSNTCTAQVLLAVIAGTWAAWHGPTGLKQIAERIHRLTVRLSAALKNSGFTVHHDVFFDTLRCSGGERIAEKARQAGFNLRSWDNGDWGIALDELSTDQEVSRLLQAIGGSDLPADLESPLPEHLKRQDAFLQQPVFQSYHTETEMMRYLHRLETRDIALNTSMIPLGSCTMKLNAAAEMIPLSWRSVSRPHPFAPADQWIGYRQMIEQLESWLAACTGFSAVSVQPNAGSQGELAGLLAIRQFHRSQDQQRDVCLIPVSAHGTNPASAVMAGMRVVPVQCDERGNIDLDSLKEQAEQHADRLAALMVTYPSTHGVFESGIRTICDIVHEHGGQVYIGRSQPERPARPVFSGRAGSGRLPSEPAQDILHSSWRRRPGSRSDRCGRASGRISSGTSVASEAAGWSGIGNALWQCQHSHDFLDVHHAHGSRRADGSHSPRHPERQLYRSPAAAVFPDSVSRRSWLCGP